MTAPAAAPERTWRLVLSVPPSVNNLFATGFGQRGQPIRLRTAAYNAWIDREGYGQSWERLTEDKGNGIRWRCRIVAYGLAAERDVDNCIKPVLDLICRMTGLRDNWPMRRVVAERSGEAVAGEPWLVVTVEVLGETGGCPAHGAPARETGQRARRGPR